MAHQNARGFSLTEFVIYIAVFVMSTTFLIGILTTVGQVQVRQAAVTEVNQQTNFVNQTIQRLVRAASVIDIPVGAPTSTLVLRMASSTIDPTLVYASGTGVFIKEGGNPPLQITDDLVTVDSFGATRFEGGGRSLVQIDLVVKNSSARSRFLRALQTVVTRVSAATFDSDLVPGSNNIYSLGIPGVAWKDAYFSGSVGIGTPSPSAVLDVRSAISIGANAATVGYIRLPDTGSILWRNAANSANTGQIDVSDVNGMRFYDNSGSMIVTLKNGEVGIGAPSPGAKLQVSGGDAAITTQGNGLILRATDGASCFRITVNNTGTLSTSTVICP